ncbi:class I SAM-dependent methyltransferase [Candidatus Nitronereus thalassa]|uniref:Methyltransferase domain-containing protein n=1 Tax=Candidatus Nitronereus thalassa TaxID=3020898 RepID=A0ABU3K858_9BACT|nr:methyltransferase domain-containing protein [Candidatus Nitronereus thalassa]MDT7042629.1 methyltransferase domain-containing protein [Candidatus Nitronereus thalassa]
MSALTSLIHRLFVRPSMVFRLLIVGSTFMMVSVVEAAPKDKERWDRKYGTEEYIFGKTPIAFLKKYLHLLPKGKALDIAMGEGRNGVFLAAQGFQVTGIDISETGLSKARTLAKEQGVSIETQVVDLETTELPANTYDVIICTYYLQRNLFPQIINALKPGGMVVVETYTVDHQKYRPRFPRQFLLEPNELLHHFKDLTVLQYQLQDDGQTAYASILAAKPKPVRH